MSLHMGCIPRITTGRKPPPPPGLRDSGRLRDGRVPSGTSGTVRDRCHLREAVWRCMMYGVYGCMAVCAVCAVYAV